MSKVYLPTEAEACDPNVVYLVIKSGGRFIATRKSKWENGDYMITWSVDTHLGVNSIALKRYMAETWEVVYLEEGSYNCWTSKYSFPLIPFREIEARDAIQLTQAHIVKEAEDLKD